MKCISDVSIGLVFGECGPPRDVKPVSNVMMVSSKHELCSNLVSHFTWCGESIICSKGMSDDRWIYVL